MVVGGWVVGGGGHSTTLGLAGGGLSGRHSSMWRRQSSGSIVEGNLVGGHGAHTVK